jgi:hypothetical protein
MAKVTQNRLLGESSFLLKSVRDSEQELPGVGRYAVALEQAQARAMRSRRRRDSLLGATREATRRMHADLKAHRDAVSAIRNFIKSVLGQHNEMLIRYGIRPIRKRGGIRGGLPN